MACASIGDSEYKYVDGASPGIFRKIHPLHESAYETTVWFTPNHSGTHGVTTLSYLMTESRLLCLPWVSLPAKCSPPPQAVTLHAKFTCCPRTTDFPLLVPTVFLHLGIWCLVALKAEVGDVGTKKERSACPHPVLEARSSVTGTDVLRD